MPQFAYIARNLTGEKLSGTIAAATQREAISLLSGRSLFPVEVSAEKKANRGLGGRRVGGQLMATTYAQLGSLMRSGVPLLRSVQVIKNQSSNARLSEVLDDVHTRVEDGESLGDAMA